MLKNIELFDKLSLRFNGRVLFIKDVIGDEICCWSFYGQGRKIAEVCCTSIVYATEKKQTKVYRWCSRSTCNPRKEERRLMCDALFLLVGGVPRSPNLWGDPQHSAVWVPRWQRSRQCPPGGYRGRRRSISSSRWRWGARTYRASSQNSHQTTRWPHSPPPVTSSPRHCSLSLPLDGLCTTLVPYNEILFVSIILSPAFLQENTAIKWVPCNHA